MWAKITLVRLVALLWGIAYFGVIVESSKPYCSPADGFSYNCYNYKSFPVNFDNPKNVTHLTMYYNKNSIEKLQNDILLTSNLLNLEFLYLGGSRIKEIEIHAFRGGDKLAILDLRINEITNLDLNVFEGLQNLNRLILDHNPLKLFLNGSVFPKLPLFQLEMYGCEIDTINLNIFRNLESLQELNLANNPFKGFHKSEEFPRMNLTLLDLSNCSIHSVHPSLFENLMNLTRLYLNNNLLTSIDGKVFNSLQNLKYFNFGTNPLYCDCQLKYNLDLLDQTTLIWRIWRPTCSSSFHGHNSVAQNSSGALIRRIIDHGSQICSPEVTQLYTIETNSIPSISKKFGKQLDNRDNLQKVFSMACEYRGYPEPVASWTVDGMHLSLNTPAKTGTICLQELEVPPFCSNFKQTLTIILPTSLQNEGRFQCHVLNSNGVDSKGILVDLLTTGKYIQMEDNKNASSLQNEWNSLFKIVIGCFTLVVLLLLSITIGAIFFGFYNFKHSRNLATHGFDKALPPNLAVSVQTRSNFDEPQYPPLFSEAVNPSYDYACSDDTTVPENVYEMPVLSP